MASRGIAGFRFCTELSMAEEQNLRFEKYQIQSTKYKKYQTQKYEKKNPQRADRRFLALFLDHFADGRYGTFPKKPRPHEK